MEKSQVKLRNAIWEMYMGPGVQEGKCILCDARTIIKGTNSGFEACHVIARVYIGNIIPSRYYLVPGCSGCNKQCGTLCILDFLYNYNRHTQLKRLIRIICEKYVEENGPHILPSDRMDWKILRYLYGSETFIAGGGITNETAIYEIARVQEAERLINEAARINQQLAGVSTRLGALLESTIASRGLSVHSARPPIVDQ